MGRLMLGVRFELCLVLGFGVEIGNRELHACICTAL